MIATFATTMIMTPMPVIAGMYSTLTVNAWSWVWGGEDSLGTSRGQGPLSLEDARAGCTSGVPLPLVGNPPLRARRQRARPPVAGTWSS